VNFRPGGIFVQEIAEKRALDVIEIEREMAGT